MTDDPSVLEEAKKKLKWPEESREQLLRVFLCDCGFMDVGFSSDGPGKPPWLVDALRRVNGT
jgi:hypothetical protein